MDAFLLAGLAGLCFGGLTVAVRVGLGRSADPGAAPALIAACAALLTAAVAGAAGSFAGADGGTLWRFAAIGAAVPGASQLLFVAAVRHAGASRAAVVIGIAPVLSAALAVAFLDEPLTGVLGIATALIVVGGAALAGEGARPHDFRAVGIAFALACAGMFAVRDILVRAVARDVEIEPLAAAAASLCGAAAILLLLLAGRRGRVRLEPRRLLAELRAFWAAAVFLALAYGALIAAFDLGRVTVVAPLNATQSLWAVVGSAILLRRSEAIGVRLVLAAVLVVAGSALIGATR